MKDIIAVDFSELSEEKRSMIMPCIREYFVMNNISPTCGGFRYLLEMVILFLANPTLSPHRLYAIVASRYDIKDAVVKTAVTSALKNSTFPDLSVKEFIRGASNTVLVSDVSFISELLKGVKA